MKHTPAPWKIVDSINIESTDGLVIANVYWSSEVEGKANLKLIAAAPEVLEACIISLRYFNGIDTEAQSEAAFHALNNAIKKATL